MTGRKILAGAIMTMMGGLQGCGGGIATPEPGDVEISTATAGHDPDPDGYTARLDGVRVTSIPTDGTTRFTEVAAGNHAAELTGVAEHCTVQGDNPRNFAVRSGGTSTVAFSVECEAITGDLRVSVSTTGEEQDSTGYVAAVDTARTDSLAPNDTTTFRRLPPDDYSVELRDVAENCTVQGENPQTVTVEAGVTSEARFTVECAAASGSVSAARLGGAQRATGAAAGRGPEGHTVQRNATPRPGHARVGNPDPEAGMLKLVLRIIA